jgi:hypothetical protein
MGLAYNVVIAGLTRAPHAAAAPDRRVKPGDDGV